LPEGLIVILMQKAQLTIKQPNHQKILLKSIWKQSQKH